MHISILNMPKREPDLVLPRQPDIYEVKVWIHECLFLIDDALHDSISSGSINLDSCKDPMEYIVATAQRSPFEERRRAANKFLEELDLILTGGNYDQAHYGTTAV